MTSTMDAKSFVLNTPVIVQNIFKHLPAFDICRCARVNILWNTVSTAELNRRKRPIHFYLEFPDQKENASYGGCSVKNAKTFEDEFDQQIRNLEVKPAFCIAFMTSTLWENFEKFFPSHPIYEPKRMKFDNFKGTPRQRHLESIINTALRKRLPPDCQVCLYVGISIIGIERDSNELMEPDDPAISGYVFPELPQGGIQFCRMSNYNCEEFRITATRKNLKSSLVLMNYKTIEYYTMKLKGIWNDLSKNSVVFPVQIGSDVIPLFFGQNVKTFCFDTPFYGNRLVKVLPEPSGEGHDLHELDEPIDENRNYRVRYEPKLEDKDFSILQELEKTDFSRTGVIAFMFARIHYISFADFCKEFHEKFPHIPIAGLYGRPHNHTESKDDTKNKCLLLSFSY